MGIILHSMVRGGNFRLSGVLGVSLMVVLGLCHSNRKINSVSLLSWWAGLLSSFLISPLECVRGLGPGLFVEHIQAFYEFDQFIYSFDCAHKSSPLGIPSMSEDVWW